MRGERSLHLAVSLSTEDLRTPSGRGRPLLSLRDRRAEDLPGHGRIPGHREELRCDHGAITTTAGGTKIKCPCSSNAWRWIHMGRRASDRW